jgi:hypothetical protein
VHALAIEEPGKMDLEELEYAFWFAGALELYGLQGKKNLCPEKFRVSEEFPLATDKPASDCWW